MEINKCHICEGIAHAIRVRTGYVIVCENCEESSLDFSTQQDAIEAWNVTCSEEDLC